MNPINLDGCSRRVNFLLARRYITLEMLPALSLHDLTSIQGLGPKGLWDEVIPSILAAGVTLRHVHESREELLREIYPDPRKIPATNMAFVNVLSDTQVFCIETPKIRRRVPVYGDLTKLSRRKIEERYRKTRTGWIEEELAKYDLTFRR